MLCIVVLRTTLHEVWKREGKSKRKREREHIHVGMYLKWQWLEKRKRKGKQEKACLHTRSDTSQTKPHTELMSLSDRWVWQADDEAMGGTQKLLGSTIGGVRSRLNGDRWMYHVGLKHGWGASFSTSDPNNNIYSERQRQRGESLESSDCRVSASSSSLDAEQLAQENFGSDGGTYNSCCSWISSSQLKQTILPPD